jgi:hypothetical protein
MLRWNFSQGTHPIHFIGPKTHVLGHFAPFSYRMKVGAKRAELVPLTDKFAKRCCVGISCNERTQSTPVAQNSYFGLFRTVWLLHESWCKTGQTGAINAQVR